MGHKNGDMGGKTVRRLLRRSLGLTWERGMRSSGRAGFQDVLEENKQDLAIDWLCVGGGGTAKMTPKWRSHT